MEKLLKIGGQSGTKGQKRDKGGTNVYYISLKINKLIYTKKKVNMSQKEINPDVAIRYYKMHLKTVSEYQKRHPELMRTKNKEYNKKLKENNPEKYQEVLGKKREYYHKIRKPKLEAEKKLKEEQPLEELENEIIV